AQRAGDEVSHAVLCRLVVKNQENACPKLGGAVQNLSPSSLFDTIIALYAMNTKPHCVTVWLNILFST
ncbi:MAG: hypothetical protein L0196_09820, partial [candidate division Zixibacteria bacterium]|nr:hypothetical protein [candidate division Zixibacteria bacterium]